MVAFGTRMGSTPPLPMGTRVFDIAEAIAWVESALSDQVHWAVRPDVRKPPKFSDRNAFEGPVRVDPDPDLLPSLFRAKEAASLGVRVSVITTARELASARREVAAISKMRLGIVFHVLGDRSEVGRDVLALLDLGAAVLFPARPIEAIHLAIVARRAAEDAGAPFVIVHEHRPFRAVETLSLPDERLLFDMVGAPRERLVPYADAAHAHQAGGSDRSFTERVPFALSAALREFEGRAQLHVSPDLLEQPKGQAETLLVGVGAAGDTLTGLVPWLRAGGLDVDAVRITSLRPYPGPRLVKALARAQAVTVFEWRDDLLAQSGPLTREIKSAFADAITWAPGYPGVGRIPRIVTAIAEGVPVDAGHVLEAAHNMRLGESGSRSLSFEHTSFVEPRPADGAVVVRAVASHAGAVEDIAEAVAAVVSQLTGISVSATVRKLPEVEGDGFSLDVVVSKRPRAALTPHAVDTLLCLGATPGARGNIAQRVVAHGLVCFCDAAVPTDFESRWSPATRRNLEAKHALSRAIPLGDPQATDDLSRMFGAAVTAACVRAAARLSSREVSPEQLDRELERTWDARAVQVGRRVLSA